jgi:hypothetical protein
MPPKTHTSKEETDRNAKISSFAPRMLELLKIIKEAYEYNGLFFSREELTHRAVKQINQLLLELE